MEVSGFSEAGFVMDVGDACWGESVEEGIAGVTLIGEALLVEVKVGAATTASVGVTIMVMVSVKSPPFSILC